ncbi:MAG: hypothetical protein HOI59_12550 [Nitrospina sp.]|nr:hypothetical protein [Nitrospina sp.]MBT5259637.1 hypothetical protein [Nitrospina sp.]MBT5764687.1 hypothetical protein [Nitrospina sp.]MBT6594905.1 hypothetical protein [Nitrospina sp.]MBT7179905.1 hypothetical protein [Nitrospina sp.]
MNKSVVLLASSELSRRNEPLLSASGGSLEKKRRIVWNILNRANSYKYRD